jgi:hypothetical protein
MKNKLVIIKWIDSKGLTSEWEFRDEIQPLKPNICISVGFLIDNKIKYKTLATTISKDQVFGRITIPTCSIVKFKELS